MIRARILAMSAAWVVFATPVISAQETPVVSAHDLSRYREFQLGMSLVTVAQQADITAEARVLHFPAPPPPVSQDVSGAHRRNRIGSVGAIRRCRIRVGLRRPA